MLLVEMSIKAWALGIENNKIDFMQNSIRILSGHYGLPRAFEFDLAHRLEMGTKCPSKIIKIYMTIGKNKLVWSSTRIIER